MHRGGVRRRPHRRRGCRAATCRRSTSWRATTARGRTVTGDVDERGGRPMTSIAVIAHTGKTLGGGLTELRTVLEREGVVDPLWYEVPKSKGAPKCVRRAVKAGADLVMVWGGDGIVQRCIDAVGDDPVVLAILPAGTGNLLAHNLGVPVDLEAAVE